MVACTDVRALTSLPTKMWTPCLVLVYVIQTVFSQVQIKDPSVCDHAKERNGVGFNPHPYDCTQFVQCYYYSGGRVEPVYRNCEYGQFWDQSQLRCRPANDLDCPYDKCRIPGTEFYKHSDPNKCGAFWKCLNGKAYGQCCPEGQGFHPIKGCIPLPTCTDMCPLKDRVPGCSRRPISGAPTKFEQYTDNGVWKKENCPSGAAYNPADCSCSLTNLIVPGRDTVRFGDSNLERFGLNGQARSWVGAQYFVQSDPHSLPELVGMGFIRRCFHRNGILKHKCASFTMNPVDKVCKADVILNFDNGKVEDVSGNKYTIMSENVVPYQGAAYFRGNSKLAIEPLRPSATDEGVLIIKLRFREDNRKFAGGLQAMVTNGHCGKEPSVVIAKLNDMVLLGAEANMSRSFPLPIVNKPWKEVIYIKDENKLEGRVCGATYNDWCIGKIKDTGCGFQIGAAQNMAGYVGLLDDIHIYRCKPLETVININY